MFTDLTDARDAGLSVHTRNRLASGVLMFVAFTDCAIESK
jgi:hypothetical protein